MMAKSKDYIANKIYLDATKNIKHHILSQNSSFAVVEAYKALRTNILFTRISDGCQQIVFTSASVFEGKSINCINNGITLAQNGLKVLLIDADMRKPMLRSAFDIKEEFGLSDLLAGLANREQRAYEGGLIHKTAYDNLFVLTAGRIPPNPVELLSSKQMHFLLETLQAEFDYILIDSPPLSVVTDAGVLVPEVNGYVLITRAGKTSMEQLQTTVMRLEQLGAKIIGFILNDLDAKSGTYKYKKYGGHSRYRKYNPNTDSIIDR